MAASLVAGPALTTLSNSISTILDVLVWVIALGYVYFGWKLIFGPGGAKATGDAAGWVKEKIGAGYDKLREINKADDEAYSAKKFSMVTFKDLTDIRNVVVKASVEGDLKKIKGPEKAAKRHVSKADQRITKLESDLAKLKFPNPATEASVKKLINPIIKEIKVLNKSVIKALVDFDTMLKTPAAGAAFTAKRDALQSLIEQAITDEEGLQVEFKALYDVLHTKI